MYKSKSLKKEAIHFASLFEYIKLDREKQTFKKIKGFFFKKKIF